MGMHPWQHQPGQSGWNPSGWGPPPGQHPLGTPGGYPAPTPYGQRPPSYPPQPGPYPPKPSGSTAITAAILSFLGAATHSLRAMGVAEGVAQQWSDVAGGAGGGLFAILALVMVADVVGLVVGGIMLLRHQLAGRIVIVVSCAVVIVLQIIIFAYAATALHSYGLLGGFYGGSGLLVHAVMAGVTIALALASPTRRWCVAGRQSAPSPPPPPMWQSPPTAW